MELFLAEVIFAKFTWGNGFSLNLIAHKFTFLLQVCCVTSSNLQLVIEYLSTLFYLLTLIHVLFRKR